MFPRIGSGVGRKWAKSCGGGAEWGVGWEMATGGELGHSWATGGQDAVLTRPYAIGGSHDPNRKRLASRRLDGGAWHAGERVVNGCERVVNGSA